MTPGPDHRDQPRAKWLDILRAVGVIGVVLFHAAAPPWLLGLITPWFLGVFFFASGYTYRNEYTLHPLFLIKKRFFSLYLPLIAWQFGYLALHNVFFTMSILSDKAGYQSATTRLYAMGDFYRVAKSIIVMRGGEDMAGALWFLVALITVNVVFCLLSAANARFLGGREWMRAVMIIAVGAIGCTNQTAVAFPSYLNFSLLCVSFFYAGQLYRQHEARVPTGLYPTALAAAVLWMGRGTTLGLTITGNVAATVVTVLAGIYLVLQLSKAIGPQPFLEYIGRNSFAIIAMHFVAFKLVSLVMISVQGLPHYMLAKFPIITGADGWWLAYSVVGLGAPLLVTLGYHAAAKRVRGDAALRTVGG